MFFFLSAFGNYVSIRRQLTAAPVRGGAAGRASARRDSLWGSVFLGVAVSSWWGQPRVWTGTLGHIPQCPRATGVR